VASFIHIADAKNRARIERNGVLAGRRGVFSLPVTRDFAVTHQWARELKRRGTRALICVQFRVPDDEPVCIGRYNGDKLAMTAAEAVATTAAHTDPMGLEVIFARRILPKEIVRIYPAPRVVGWRYYPAAKGKPPFCHCRACNRGDIRARRIIRDDPA
jgi:hypothetical protein